LDDAAIIKTAAVRTPYRRVQFELIRGVFMG
jgi:hypothetical protein